MKLAEKKVDATLLNTFMARAMNSVVQCGEARMTARVCPVRMKQQPGS